MWKLSISVRRRPEAILDVYNLLLGALLFLSPWLFAFAHGAAGADAWLGGAVIAAVSLAALMAYAEWEEWIALVAGLWMIAVALRLRLYAYDGDARSHWDRLRRHFPRGARSLAHPLWRGSDRALRFSADPSRASSELQERSERLSRASSRPARRTRSCCRRGRRCRSSARRCRHGVRGRTSPRPARGGRRARARPRR